MFGKATSPQVEEIFIILPHPVQIKISKKKNKKIKTLVNKYFCSLVFCIQYVFLRNEKKTY